MIKILLRTQSKWTKWLCRLSYVCALRCRGRGKLRPSSTLHKLPALLYFDCLRSRVWNGVWTSLSCSFMRGPLFSLLFNIWLVDTFYAVEPKVIAPPPPPTLHLHVSLDSSAKLAGKYKNCWFVLPLSLFPSLCRCSPAPLCSVIPQRVYSFPF